MGCPWETGRASASPSISPFPALLPLVGRPPRRARTGVGRGSGGVAAVGAQSAGLVVGHRVGTVERARVQPDPLAELEAAAQNVGEQVPAEADALERGHEPEVRDLDAAVGLRRKLGVPRALAADGRHPRLDPLRVGLPGGVTAAQVVDPLVLATDVLVEPAVHAPVGRVDTLDRGATYTRRPRRADARGVVELEPGGDDAAAHSWRLEERFRESARDGAGASESASGGGAGGACDASGGG